MYLYKNITDNIINSAFEVHRELGKGFLEKVYENAFVYELNYKDLKTEQQKKVEVIYKNQFIGYYIADIVVEDSIIIELKTVSELSDIHKIQLLNYLKATNMKLGLLINFGADKIQIKRVINTE